MTFSSRWPLGLEARPESAASGGGVRKRERWCCPCARPPGAPGLALEARACCCMCPLLLFLVAPSKSTKAVHKTAVMNGNTIPRSPMSAQNPSALARTPGQVPQNNGASFWMGLIYRAVTVGNDPHLTKRGNGARKNNGLSARSTAL